MELKEVIIIGRADEWRRSLSLVRQTTGGEGGRGSRRGGVESPGDGGGDIREWELEHVEDVEAGEWEVEVKAGELDGEAQQGEGGAKSNVVVDDKSYILCYLPLYRAALTNDWETAEDIVNQDPNADTAFITLSQETTLHIAVGTNNCHSFVDKLVNRIANKDITKLRTTNVHATNSLHIAAIVGNTKAAKALVEKDPGMTLIPNKLGSTPLQLAACYAQRETLEYLLEVTPNDQIGEGETSSYSGEKGVELITCIIHHGFYDIAMELIEKYPNLATETYGDNKFALEALAATDPNALFPSGSSPWFPLFSFICSGIYREFIIQDIKLKHKQAVQLMKIMIKQILNTKNHSKVWHILGKAMSIAARYGNYEMVEECLVQYPDLILHADDDGMYLFMTAIKHRQVKVYNLVHQMTGHVVFLATSKNKDEENALHLVARKVSMGDSLSQQVHRGMLSAIGMVGGAALEMQRELQWFKEVEKFVGPSCKNNLNNQNKTARMIFMEEHTELVEKGEKWVKETAKSLTLVAVLIATVAFAAIFTVPGGNKDDGTPYFLRTTGFMAFAISDAVALFSSVTSVLMFVSLLTSRYAQDDFLHAIPERLTIGLLSLFISIAAIMFTYSAAVTLVLTNKFYWVMISIGGVGIAVPTGFFIRLQFPLLLELVHATYGPSIFRKQNNLIFH